ncbi:MAG: UDP-N-acetylmuramoyl-tripeptide--D-alanyl-D-alanine ligase [Vicinamibacteria bacterium]|nr:UDP-N-acetylmuramoyl-tripeptide--D-alanyl-D-alanine ligase [Vicinamibacteria bacterium]
MRILETLSWVEIAQALGAKPGGTPAGAPSGASIDTRTLERGDIFFALKGERADGHEHVGAAFEKGASCAVVRAGSPSHPGRFALEVDDPERALFELGRLVRSRSLATFVAVTGSAGKTTAKEFTAELLRARGEVLATRGNLNNHLGVPLTLARLETGHWAAVIECGMSHAGEIRHLVRLILPKVAVVTNVAAVHLEYFASVDEIAAAKAEIFETLGAGDIAVAPADEPRLTSRVLGKAFTARLFGAGESSSVRADNTVMSLEGSIFDLVSSTRVEVRLEAPGPHAIANFLAAAAVAEALGIDVREIAERVPLLRPSGNRGAVKRLADDILVIDDTYNSNPRALLSAIETLSLATGRRKVACVGEMLELGESSAKLHRDAGAALGPRVDLLLSVGALAKEIVLGASTLAPDAKRVFETSAELAANISSLVKSHDAVLVKGSRGVRMERVVEALVAAHPGAGA